MKPSEKYAQVTAEGARKALESIIGLDDSITVGDLREFLVKREAEAKREVAEQRKALHQKLEGKCKKVSFGDQHTQILRIDTISIKEQYGSAEAYMIGERIVKYKGDFRVEVMNGESSWSQYEPNEAVEDFPLTEFDRLKSTYLALIA